MYCVGVDVGGVNTKTVLAVNTSVLMMFKSQSVRMKIEKHVV